MWSYHRVSVSELSCSEEMNGTPYCGVEKEPFPLVLAHCCMTGPEAITYIVLIGGVYNSLRKVVTPSKYVPLCLGNYWVHECSYKCAICKVLSFWQSRGIACESRARPIISHHKLGYSNSSSALYKICSMVWVVG